jgi:hypothetical protein
MLTDNAIEITLHHIAVSYTGGPRWMRNEPLKFGREAQDALGRHFEPKVKLAKLLGHFSQEVADTIVMSHDYRNEVYHVGIQHEV